MNYPLLNVGRYVPEHTRVRAKIIGLDVTIEQFDVPGGRSYPAEPTRPFDPFAFAQCPKPKEEPVDGSTTVEPLAGAAEPENDAIPD